MKYAILSAAFLISVSISQGATISNNTVGLFQGEEQVNEQPTGCACYLYFDYAEANPAGRHCYNLTTRSFVSTG